MVIIAYSVVTVDPGPGNRLVDIPGISAVLGIRVVKLGGIDVERALISELPVVTPNHVEVAHPAGSIITLCI
jgi:hypothetical protein